ncbi:hypothetical protein GY45DRAFT_1358696 [Cubamyces sp. BRFM 1775]|nr:hypothetical protein GY45DRAFT_1358696 [Cubamyces sp. BRFM 1775]
MIFSTVFIVWLIAILGVLPDNAGYNVAHWAMPALSTTTRAIFQVAGMVTMPRFLDAPHSRDALDLGAFGSSVYDPPSPSTNFSFAYDDTPLSGSYDPVHEPPSSANVTLVPARRWYNILPYIDIILVILGCIFDVVQKRREASRRPVTRATSSLRSKQNLQHSCITASLSNPAHFIINKTKKEAKKANTMTNKSPLLRANSATPILHADKIYADQARVFGVHRVSLAPITSQDDTDAEADEYLRAVFNIPDAHSPPLMGWVDRDTADASCWHPPVEDLDSWVFPGMHPPPVIEPFSPPLPSETSLAALAAADADPTRPFGFARTGSVPLPINRFEHDLEDAWLNVALGLPFTMAPFTWPWHDYCFPHEEGGRYPTVEELGEWAGVVYPRPGLQWDEILGPDEPLLVDIHDYWDG